MFSSIRNRLLLALLTASIPVALYGELVGCCRNCCSVCCQPRCVCAPTPQACYAPTVQQRDVLTTEYRTEPVSETVPATIYENVMVDEGAYQTVWVPRVTTKSVAKTVYQTRTSYRSVPYQVTRRVTEYGTQTLPYQSAYSAPIMTSPLAYTTSPAYTATGPYTYSAPATMAATPILPAAKVAASPTTGSPVPDPSFSSAAATPITPRAASNTNAGGSTGSTTARGPSLFAPAPSAAQVWRTPRGTITR